VLIYRRLSRNIQSCLSLSDSEGYLLQQCLNGNLSTVFIQHSTGPVAPIHRVNLNLKLQNQRGGRIFLQDVKKPDRDEWGSGVEALECALQLEKSVNQSLLDLHKLCSEHNDPHMCDFIENHYLDEQVKSIKELADWVTNLRRMGAPQNGMAEYLFDKHTLGKESS
uniref:Ferritin n=1 Tax=Astatotilapia calliptera TaxID=8154 RepID=A0AAX7U4Y8_ASTCA